MQGWRLDDASQKRIVELRNHFAHIHPAQLPRKLELLASLHFLGKSSIGRGKTDAELTQLLHRYGKSYTVDQMRQAIVDLAKYGSPQPQARTKLVVDSVHGDIHLRSVEQRVVDTASFQRLCHLLQLGMAQATYPNATHSRFAHSIGVLGIMDRILRLAKDPCLSASGKLKTFVWLACCTTLGTISYSHLMERIDNVQLTEDIVAGSQVFHADRPKYPNHQEVGVIIATHQQDLIEALGGPEHAKQIAELFTRKTIADPQSEQTDPQQFGYGPARLLAPGCRATGVPYGQIDLNYLLNNFRASPSGMLGVSEKAITAVDHFLLAWFFMHRSVYYHKTTFGLEEACRQLLRRGRDQGKFGIPVDGTAVADLVKGKGSLGQFTDAYVDVIVEKAAQDDDPVIMPWPNRFVAAARLNC